MLKLNRNNGTLTTSAENRRRKWMGGKKGDRKQRKWLKQIWISVTKKSKFPVIARHKVRLVERRLQDEAQHWFPLDQTDVVPLMTLRKEEIV